MQLIPFKGFVDGGYTLAGVKLDCQRCVNYYPEQDELAFSKESGQVSILPPPGFSLIPTPGAGLLYSQLDTGPVRAMWTLPDGRFLVVSNNNCYLITYTGVWSADLLGSLNTNSGYVSIADNGVQAILVDGLYGYIVTIGTPTGKATFAQIIDPNFQANGAQFVAFNDGYFILGTPNTSQWFISSLYDGTTYNSLDFASKEGSTDWLMCPKCCNGYVWLVGFNTIEVYYDSGNANFPYARISGVQLQYGAWSGASVQLLDNSLIWLGTSKAGGAVVWKMNGYTPARVSNFGVELALGACSAAQLSAATSWVYQRNGHSFYCLNVPGLTSTWVLDLATGKWHERTTLNSLGQEAQQLFTVACAAYGYIIGGDVNGNVFTLQEGLCTDNGGPIERIRTSPHIGRMMNNVIHNRIELNLQTGVGVGGSGQGKAPVMVMQYSNDGGQTWSNERSSAMGTQGEYLTRVRWDQCGVARDRVYRIKQTDPVWSPIVGAQIGITAGRA